VKREKENMSSSDKKAKREKEKEDAKTHKLALKGKTIVYNTLSFAD